MFISTAIVVILPAFSIKLHLNFYDPGILQASLLQLRRERVSTIALGDSMTAMSFHPGLGNMFNFSSPGDSLNDMEDKFDFALTALPGLSSVIVQYSPEMFSIDRSNQKPKYRELNLIKDLSCTYYSLCSEVSLYNKIRNFVIGYRILISDVMRPTGSGAVQNDGFLVFRLDKQWFIDEALVGKDDNDIGFSPLQQEKLRHLISKIISFGLNVVIYSPPVYTQSLDRSWEYAGTVEEFTRRNLLKAREHIIICDLSRIFQYKYSFFNATHVAPYEAANVTLRLKECAGLND